MTYREVPQNRILVFGATPAFKGWRRFFTKDSGSHPAKMNLNLLRWILQKYTKTGDTVLDPMAGTGSTAILASLLGRHGLAVECEPQFCKMINENISRSGVHSSLKTKGSVTCLQGDARKLSDLLEKSDIIVTSPPYSDSNIGGDPDDKRLKRLQEAIDRGDKISDRNKAWLKARLRGKQNGIQFDRQRGYHGGPDNIANLKHGDIDSIVTSPPYGPTQNGGGIAVKGYQGSKHSPSDLLAKKSYTPDKFDESNISNLPYGDINSIVMSPPYSESKTETNGEKGKRGGDSRLRVKKDYAEVSEGNIQKLPHGDIDSIITSPPYGNRLSDIAVHDGDPARMGYRQTVDVVLTSPPYEKVCLDGRDPEARKRRLEEAGHDPKDFLGGHSRNVGLKGYGKLDTDITLLAEDNIGNLEDENYLQAMLQVYRECHKVLSPGGVMILVTKNFIRDKKVIRLDLETTRLCEEAGFSLLDHWYFKLPTRSFWRILYREKFPEVPDIIFEDILVFEKGAENA